MIDDEIPPQVEGSDLAVHVRVEYSSRAYPSTPWREPRASYEPWGLVLVAPSRHVFLLTL